MNVFENILVVRTDRIGDVILTTPAIRELRTQFPHARITVLLAPLTKNLLVGNPDIDEILIDDRMGVHSGGWGFFKLIQILRKKRFDLAVVLHTKKRTNALCFLSGIPNRIGYHNNKYGFLLTHPLNDRRHLGELHEAQYCLNVMRNIPGIQHSQTERPLDDLCLFVSRISEADAWVNDFMRQENLSGENKIVAVHAGASDIEKRCSALFFSELIESLIKKYNVKILLLGADYLKDLSIEIVSELSPNSRLNVFDMVGVTSIEQMVSVLARCSLLISNDSGPVHVAASLKIPVISLFVRNKGGVNPERWRPLGQKSRFISVPRQKNGTDDLHKKKSWNMGELKNQEWQDFITKDRILEEVDSLFKL